MNGGLTHIDLFSGIGGFIEAAAQTGFTTIMGCEIEDDCREYLVRRYGIPVAADIKETDFRSYAGATLVTGGPPCQPASLAGKRKGAGDHRWLWPEAIRVVSKVRPDWFVFENPPGIKTMGLDGILTELEGCASGYETTVLDIPACAVNAPHLRHRIWIVGNRRDAHNQHGKLRGYGSGENGGEQSGQTNLSRNKITGTADAMLQRRGAERDVSGWAPGIKSAGGDKTNAAADIADAACVGRNKIRPEPGRQGRAAGAPVHDGYADNIREQQPPISRQEFRDGANDNVEDGCDTDGTRLQEHPDVIRAHKTSGKTNARQADNRTATAYDNYSLIRRWTGREWVVSRVLRGFSGLDDGPRTRRVLEAMGNAVVVPVAVEILRAIRIAIEKG